MSDLNLDLRPWYACEQPEHLPNATVRWHYAVGDNHRCTGCVLAARAVAFRHPEDPHVRWLLHMVVGPEPVAS